MIEANIHTAHDSHKLAARKLGKHAFAVDIGAASIRCLAGRPVPYRFDDPNDAPPLNIISYTQQQAQGIEGGEIIAIDAFEASLKSALNQATKASGRRVNRVVVGLSSHNLRNIDGVQSVPIRGSEVDDEDMENAWHQWVEKITSPDLAPLHVTPRFYEIDGRGGVVDPRGAFGAKLDVGFCALGMSQRSLRDMIACFQRLRVRVDDFAFNAHAAATATLTTEERGLGAVCLDIGASGTAMAVFRRNTFFCAETSSIGGAHITRDIAHALGVSLDRAERLKILHGDVRTLDYPDLASPLEINRGLSSDGDDDIEKNRLSAIIRPRAEEILELARDRLIHHRIDLNGYRLVLTGGGALLGGLDHLATQIWGCPARLGQPNGLPVTALNTQFSSCIGLLRHQAMRLAAPAGNSQTSSKATLSRWLRRFCHGF